jgi:mRNA-degrading endonuclease RelE of RelBE toxin-antitoxin system
MPWLVRLSTDAGKQVERLPADRQDQLLRSLREMAEDPFRGDVKPLKGRKSRGHYRKRAGRYRVIFLPQHQGRIINIYAVGPKAQKTYHWLSRRGGSWRGATN